MPNFIDLTGKRFGRLTVLQRIKNQDSPKKIMWKCLCDCGNECAVNGVLLREGKTRSCGCLAKEILIERNYKHGYAHTRLNNIWKDMIRRCKSPRRPAHKYYHDKGVTVCEEWAQNFDSFREWAYKNGYRDDLTIDRIDTDGNYEPNNCRWVTMKAQCNNRTSNFNITYNGQTHTLSEWSEITGINCGTIRARIKDYGWSINEALTTPPIKGRR